VWGGKPYPIIWYYDSSKHGNVPFEESFTYYESIASDYAQEYFKNIEQHSGCIPKHLIVDKCKAIGKIGIDIGNDKKIKYIKELIKHPGGKPSRNNDFCENRLELHFAAICCDVMNKKILILRRAGREVLDAKWEFGCAKANAEEHIEDIVERTYKENLGLTIEVIKDISRSEGRAKPIALYEYSEGENNHKGVIIVAKVIGGEEAVGTYIKKTGRYDKFLWLSESEVDCFYEDTVQDLKESMKNVFDNWKKYFTEEETGDGK